MNTCRVHGMGIMYFEHSQGSPQMFARLIIDLPSLHSVVVLFSIKATPTSRVSLGDRHSHTQQIEVATIVEQLDEEEENAIVVPRVSSDSIQPIEIVGSEDEVENEMELIDTARRNGVNHMCGEIEITANPNSSIFRKAGSQVLNFINECLHACVRACEAFALYSLMCKHAKVNFTPSQQSEDREIDSNNRHKLKEMIENSSVALGYTHDIIETAMMIGDGIFTPLMSVFVFDHTWIWLEIGWQVCGEGCVNIVESGRRMFWKEVGTEYSGICREYGDFKLK
ncbi:hypothetical protein TSUD_176050 [Trifolium subterraneum]|uniref:Uncharacterized protein n=1 Tax=Trifolium subterraneum TaxID=3900 RepID=A0A2Z6M7W9_TRISU|nr:hypothetical protein TSUD_176050 [Trifolium subterraneum]